jgi:hypothetical protein
VVHPSRYEFDSVGLLKTDGSWAIGPVHGALGYLRDGLALMRSGPLGTDTSWGFVDASGTAAFAARFSAAREFSEGMAAAEARRDGRYKFGYIDRQGRRAITSLARIHRKIRQADATAIGIERWPGKGIDLG